MVRQIDILEHDSAEDDKLSVPPKSRDVAKEKDDKPPTGDVSEAFKRAIRERGHEARIAMKERTNRSNKPWLDVENPAIWDGEID